MFFSELQAFFSEMEIMVSDPELKKANAKELS